MLKRLAYRILPTPMRIQGIPSYSKNLCLDVADSLTGRRRAEEPPRRLNVSGEGSFCDLGQHNVSICREYGHLAATDRVLDLGCGIGRTALAMRDFLQPPGSYVGLDIIPFAIRWCNRHISSSTEANLQFVHADIFNLMYNPAGKLSPDRFSFPFAAESFSFCVATSLFTHLLPNAIENYIKQVARVLRVGGSFTSTWFLLDQETKAAIDSGHSRLNFPFRLQRHSQRSLHAPEQAVAYDLAYLEDVYGQAGLTVKMVHFGGWSGVKDSIDSGQDLIVATRLV